MTEDFKKMFSEAVRGLKDGDIATFDTAYKNVSEIAPKDSFFKHPTVLEALRAAYKFGWECGWNRCAEQQEVLFGSHAVKVEHFDGKGCG